MFDIGATELLVIGIVAIIVVGPKELPKMLRTFGQFVAKMRGMAREFQTMFEEAARDTGVDDITKSVSDVKNFSVTDSVSNVLNPVSEDLKDMELDLETPETSSTAPAKKAEDPVEAGNKAAKAASEKTDPKPGAKKKPAPHKPRRAKSKAKSTG